MNATRSHLSWGIWCLVVCVPMWTGSALAQLTDRTQAPNNAQAGIAKSLQDQTGAGRGDAMSWNSSIFIIQRDPFRSIRCGRQLFQRILRASRDKARIMAMAPAISTPMAHSVRDSPTVVPCAMDGRAVQPGPEEMSQLGRIAAMLPTYSDSA
jgi:hypothetical protein